jgi:protein-S-isoprenylcysteine O-methyltransferase Ste14
MAMVLMAAGEVVAIKSLAIWVLLPLTLAYLELLVGPWEERQMAREFGAEYDAYARLVNKWLPRRARIHQEHMNNTEARTTCPDCGGGLPAPG